METNAEKLINLCKEEMEDKGYSCDYKGRISRVWEQLLQWMEEKGETEFTAETGCSFCDEKAGLHAPRKGIRKSQRVCIRAVRMLISFQKEGGIEGKAPRAEYCFTGQLGQWILEYIAHLENETNLKLSTVSAKKSILHRFNLFMQGHGYSSDDISFGLFEKFDAECQCPPRSVIIRHNEIRRFLSHLYKTGKTVADKSVFLPKDKLVYPDIQDFYTHEEIKASLAAVDRSSAIGKRDYLILVLAAEYGWRGSDIRTFRLDQIDWEKNIIKFRQFKTDIPVEYPLLPSVGNALIDYLKNARPNSDAPHVILSVKPSKKDDVLAPSTLSTLATHYLKIAVGSGNRKGGTHAYRRSLAANMLNDGVAMPVISGVLGHSSLQTTNTYLKVDYVDLAKCALPMPALHSMYYKRGGGLA